MTNINKLIRRLAVNGSSNHTLYGKALEIPVDMSLPCGDKDDFISSAYTVLKFMQIEPGACTLGEVLDGIITDMAVTNNTLFIMDTRIPYKSSMCITSISLLLKGNVLNIRLETGSVEMTRELDRLTGVWTVILGYVAVRSGNVMGTLVIATTDVFLTAKSASLLKDSDRIELSRAPLVMDEVSYISSIDQLELDHLMG